MAQAKYHVALLFLCDVVVSGVPSLLHGPSIPQARPLQRGTALLFRAAVQHPGNEELDIA